VPIFTKNERKHSNWNSKTDFTTINGLQVPVKFKIKPKHIPFVDNLLTENEQKRLTTQFTPNMVDCVVDEVEKPTAFDNDVVNRKPVRSDISEFPFESFDGMFPDFKLSKKFQDFKNFAVQYEKFRIENDELIRKTYGNAYFEKAKQLANPNCSNNKELIKELQRLAATANLHKN
jgi:hypothetical protein